MKIDAEKLSSVANCVVSIENVTEESRISVAEFTDQFGHDCRLDLVVRRKSRACPPLNECFDCTLQERTQGNE